MLLTEIVDRVNHKLAGERFGYEDIKYFIDDVIDDINTQLGAKFPSMSEFKLLPNYPDYNFFPDQYLRSVLIPGVAYKFYTTDEEGAQTAQVYGQEYTTNLFYMHRDYGNLVPVEYRATDSGAFTVPDGFLAPSVTLIQFEQW